jgi:hypothetical protein
MPREPYATLAGGSFAAAAADKPAFVGRNPFINFVV